MIIEREYEYLRCSCDGIIGCYDRDNFTFDKCNKEYALYTLIYDYLGINDKTGWIFPMRSKKDKCIINVELKQRIMHKARKLGCEGDECLLSYGGHPYLVKFKEDIVIRQLEYK